MLEELNQFTREKNAKRNPYKGVLLRFLLSCLAVFTLHCRFEIYGGGFPDSALLNGLNKLYNTFSGPDFADLFVLFAVYILLRFVHEKDEGIDLSTLLLSLVLAMTLLTAISFKKFNSTAILFANSYQVLMSGFCIAGFCVILYGLLRWVYHTFGKGLPLMEERSQNTFLEKHFHLIGFCIIFLGWLPFILMNYPGSGCPDSVLQLKQFFGAQTWGAGHPPLSTVIMGSLFMLGRWLIDANFGFFLYCLLQTCVGAWIFSLSMKKLQNLGISVRWCMVGIVYFAFTPLWGTYAQWVEKDLLYAEIAVLQTICMMEIIAKKQCDRRDAVLLACTTLGAVFLRNNGVYAVLPALLLLAVWLRGAARRRIVVVILVTLVCYEGIMKGLYPALGVQGISIVESLSIPFQQTARYVNEHTDEVTAYEKQVIDNVFGYESMFGYNPVISDPVKIHYRGADLTEYFKVWVQMFFKHPGTYVSAFINMGYGYLAPVSQDIEAWIQVEYYDYMKEISLYHVFDAKVSYILIQVWNLSMTLPLVKYLCTPGLYTWIVAVLAIMLVKRRRYSALILFVPSFMNILVCLASPLAGAIRYALPTVASVPLLIGWAYFSFRKSEEN